MWVFVFLHSTRLNFYIRAVNTVPGSSMSNLLFIHYFKLRQQNVRECQSSWARFQSFWFRVLFSGCGDFRFMIEKIKPVSELYCWYDAEEANALERDIHLSLQLNSDRLSIFVSVTSNLFNSPIATVPEMTHTHVLHTHWIQSHLVIKVRTICFPLWLLFSLLAKTKPVSHWTIQRLFVSEKPSANLHKTSFKHVIEAQYWSRLRLSSSVAIDFIFYL